MSNIKQIERVQNLQIYQIFLLLYLDCNRSQSFHRIDKKNLHIYTLLSSYVIIIVIKQDIPLSFRCIMNST